MLSDPRTCPRGGRRRWVAPAAVAVWLASAAGAPAAGAATSQPSVSATQASLAPTATWTPSVARWIWLPGEEKPANAYVQFRKTISLDSAPSKATVHASADCKYLL